MSRSSSSTSSSDSSDWNKSAQVHCCRKIEALVLLLANSMIVRQGMFFKYEKRRHARKCVIWPILGTSFSTNRHIYIIPSFAVRASSNMLKHKMGSEIFLWSPPTFFSWPHKWGAQSGSRFEVYNVFFLAMFAECVSSFVRLTTLIVLLECLRGDLWVMSCHESFAWRSACHLFQVLADALRGQQNHHTPSPPQQPNWRWGSQGLVAAAGGVWRIIENIEIQSNYFSGSTICSRDEFGALSK